MLRGRKSGFRASVRRLPGPEPSSALATEVGTRKVGFVCGGYSIGRLLNPLRSPNFDFRAGVWPFDAFEGALGAPTLNLAAKIKDALRTTLILAAKFKVGAPAAPSKASKGQIRHENQSLGLLNGFSRLPIEQPPQTKPAERGAEAAYLSCLPGPRATRK